MVDFKLSDTLDQVAPSQQLSVTKTKTALTIRQLALSKSKQGHRNSDYEEGAPEEFTLLSSRSKKLEMEKDEEGQHIQSDIENNDFDKHLDPRGQGDQQEAEEVV